MSTSRPLRGQYGLLVGTVDNHGNTAEITATMNAVILPKSWQNAVFLPKCRTFTFSEEYFVFNQHNLKLLCEFNTKIFTFNLSLLPKSVCFVIYWRNM